VVVFAEADRTGGLLDGGRGLCIVTADTTAELTVDFLSMERVFLFFFPFFFAALGGVESDTCGRTLLYISTLSLRRAYQDSPLASEILIKFGGQSIVSHWIGVAEAVVSAALAYHQHAGTSEAKLHRTHFGIYGGKQMEN
jgi:hypothetical protein